MLYQYWKPRHLLFLQFILLLSLPSFSQQRFHIEVAVNQHSNSGLYLSYFENNTAVRVTGIISGNKLIFTGNFKEPVMAGLTRPGLANMAWFYLDTGHIRIKATVRTTLKNKDTLFTVSIKSIQGSNSENLRNFLIASYKKVKNSSYPDSTKAKKLFDIYYPFVSKYPAHNLSGELLTQTDLLNYQQATTIYNTLSKTQQQKAAQNGVLKSLERTKRTETGSAFHYVEQPDTTGNPVKLDTVKYKILLVEFWASWCKPCRESHKEHLQLYKKFKHHGFEILSISVDNNAESWKKAIQQDKLEWLNISTLNGLQNELFNYYQLDYVPYYLLVDSKGKIMARNPDIKQIEKKIAEYTK